MVLYRANAGRIWALENFGAQIGQRETPGPWLDHLGHTDPEKKSPKKIHIEHCHEHDQEMTPAQNAKLEANALAIEHSMRIGAAVTAAVCVRGNKPGYSRRLQGRIDMTDRGLLPPGRARCCAKPGAPPRVGSTRVRAHPAGACRISGPARSGHHRRRFSRRRPDSDLLSGGC